MPLDGKVSIDAAFCDASHIRAIVASVKSDNVYR